MKKIISAFLCLFSSYALQALPLGNPAEPALLSRGIWFSGTGRSNDYYHSCFDQWSFSIGYCGDFVFNRNLQIRSGQGLDQGRVIRETQLTTNAGYLSVAFWDCVEIFGTLGASRLRIHTPETSWFLAGHHEGTLLTDTHFSGSVGARALLFNWRCFSLGFEGQYFRMQPRLSHYTSEGFRATTNYFHDVSSTYCEWQVGGGLSYSLKTMQPNFVVVPYIGCKWSKLNFTTHNLSFVDGGLFGNTLTLFDLSAHKNYGWAVGTTFAFGSQIEITIERRFADERAVSINGQVCF
jgi:major outer membrane protein